MTKQERFRNLAVQLYEAGFNGDETEKLLRIERTLTRWAELCCGDSDDYKSWSIERDEESGKPFLCVYPHTGKSYRAPARDMESGALNRLQKIMAKHPAFVAYHQTDPRGCALYIVRVSDLTNGCTLENSYNRGIAVCI